MILLCYWTATDYYEDVQGATEKRALRRRQKKGLSKKQTTFFYKKRKISVGKAGTGPLALLWRARVEYSRTDLHQYFSFLTIIALVAGVVIGYFMSKPGASVFPVYIVNGIVAYVLFIFTASQSRFNEWSKPYVYLIPGSPLQKIIAVNLLDIIRMTINVLVLNAAIYFWIQISPLVFVVMVLFVISFYMLNLSSGFIIRVLFPNAVDHKTLFPIFLMLQIILLLLPGIISGAVLAFIFQTPLAFFLGVVLANIVTIVVTLAIANKLFAYLEWK